MKGLVLDAVWEPKPTYKVSDWEQQTGKAITGNAIWRNPNLEVKSWPDPKPGPKQVLLEIQACGVCGSDMHFYETDDDNYILYPGLTKFPTILGHEFTGKVVELGKEVTLLEQGWTTVLASDAHRADKRKPSIEAGRRIAADIVGEEASWRMVRENPAKILGLN